jgi:hypothetical protein
LISDTRPCRAEIELNNAFTTVSRKWISEKLGMGDLSRVTLAVRKVNSGKESEIRRWKRQMEKNS